MKTISFLVCPNGFGHLKRVLKIVSVLIEYDIKINVLCNKKSIDNLLFFTDETLLKNKKVNFLEINFPAYGTWLNDLNKYDFYEYKSWIDNMDSEYLEKSDLLVSDNLAGILIRRPDAILEGSFLWSDVMNDLPGKTEDLKKIIELENKLLKKIRPEMICNENFAIPAIIELTNYKKFGWTCEELDINENDSVKKLEEIKILITGGGTETNEKSFEKIIYELTNPNQVKIYVDSKLFDLYLEKYNNILKFDFSEEEFNSLSFVICRPGIGILTDCVKYAIPVIPLPVENKEMMFNYKRIIELNLGMSFDALLDFLNNKNRKIYQQIFRNLIKLNKNGHIKISEYLLNKLHN